MLKNRGFYKGINLGGWFSQCDYSEETLDFFITEKDIQKISSWGADHVRIPFDYNVFETTDGTFLESGFQRLENAVQLCLKYNLNVVLDLHKTIGFSFDSYSENESGFFESAAYQELFYSLWEKLAHRFGHYYKNVAFELLNEVTEQRYISTWNRIANSCIQRIRKFAPETLILVGSYENNSAKTVCELDSPYDSNVIYNMHCYEPLKFTHQGAYWTDKINKDERISFEELGCVPEYFEDLFSSAIEKAKKENTFLYCGEYGVIDVVAPQDSLKWLACINSIFEKYHIGRCLWTYKGLDFGITNSNLDSVRNEMIKYI